MAKKFFLTAVLILALAGSADARSRGLAFHSVQIVDEMGIAVTNISSVNIYLAGSTTNATIYKDRGLVSAITQPITTSSTNTTLSNGYLYWWGPDQYDFSITDGTNTHTNSGFRARTASEGRIEFGSYLHAAATTSWTDAQSITLGTGADFVINAGATADRLTITPATADTSMIYLGSRSYPCDVNMWGATSGYDCWWDASSDDFIFEDNALLAIGSGKDYTISHNGTTTTVAGAWTASGIATFSTDVVLDGTYDIQYDDNRYQLLFQDNAVLGIGGAADAAGDVVIYHNGSDLYIDAAIADEGMLIGDTTSGFDIAYRFEGAGEFRTDYDGDFINLTDDMDLRFGTGASADGDFQISSDSSNVLAIAQVVADTGTITVGADGTDIPIKWYAETASSYFQLTGDDVNIEAMNLALGDGDYLLFGDTLGTGDFAISDQTDVLTIDVVVAGTGEIAIGNDADDVPLTWYAETTNDFIKFTGDDLQLEDVSLCLADSTELQFGDALGTGDIKVYATGTDLIIDGVVAETGTVAIGVTDLGLDFKLWAATDADGVLWDASDEALEFTGSNIVVDDGSITLNDDDDLRFGDSGEMNMEFDEDGTDTILVKGWFLPDSADPNTHTGNRTLNTDSDVGTWHLCATDGTVFTLPATAAGLVYRFMNIGADGAVGLVIELDGGDKFIGGCGIANTMDDGDQLDNTKGTADLGDFVVVMADGTNGWYIIEKQGTWEDGGA